MGAFLHRLRTACRGCWHTLLFRHVCGHTDQNQKPVAYFSAPGEDVTACFMMKKIPEPTLYYLRYIPMKICRFAWLR